MKLEKQAIAVFFGGHSSEYGVSLESAYSVIRNLDAQKYTPLPVGITKEGKWYYFTGRAEKIRADRWQNAADCIPAALCPDRGANALLLFHKDRVERRPVDAAFPVMHGKFGEDGTIQGLISMCGLPLIGCGVLPSALCMDKARAHKLAQAAGIAAPRARVFGKSYSPQEVLGFGRFLGYPLFVKPVKAGSSLGVAKVFKEAELLPAVRHALEFDDEIIVEEAVNGFEVGCAVMGNRILTVGEVDEIELSGGFFDFTEKYTLKTSAIHVPARIDLDTTSRVKETGKILYRALGCSGFARVDMFLTPKNKIIFNEINTIPGFTEHSRFPGMMKAAGISFPEILCRIVKEALSK